MAFTRPLIRELFARMCLGALERRVQRPTRRQMEAPAIVFSPHYDDETLGAGGTIVLKRRHGAPIHLVFMTDGSRSHAHLIDSRSLSLRRRSEALKAAKVLGLDEHDVTFLELPETRLEEHTSEAVGRVAELLRRVPFEQVFVPSTIEPLLWSADHNATTDIVFQSLDRCGNRPMIVEYVVWFWYQWPWVPILGEDDFRRLFTLSRKGLFGLSAARHLNMAVAITDVRAEKRAALEQHESQMTRLGGDQSWPVLEDVAHGEFLKRFFEAHEFFASYQYAARPDRAN